MFIVILIAAFGVAVGYLLRRFSWVQHANQGIHVTICFMLFVLGISVGENPLIVKNLWRFGGQALLIGFASILGSAIAAALIYRYLFTGKKDRKEGTK